MADNHGNHLPRDVQTFLTTLTARLLQAAIQTDDNTTSASRPNVGIEAVRELLLRPCDNNNNNTGDGALSKHKSRPTGASTGTRREPLAVEDTPSPPRAPLPSGEGARQPASPFAFAATSSGLGLRVQTLEHRVDAIDPGSRSVTSKSLERPLAQLRELEEEVAKLRKDIMRLRAQIHPAERGSVSFEGL
ncbi:hypothetical protein L228DRAFT_251116 [Xylona heveae TC161]|uniref:Uncharacterized protein n=1 Tax=Xylona heveae (strain CBS 132557 / TC161) TaxID=1328760 RepID=A0A164ZTT9_XYLHT|nr:hypothetical protein L228DRAFT_251116 [Xylona heveae TC161]KZF19507.1 hypothetical protein L228DRAFT_251116 [Xylona heveae TC161]